MPTKFISSLHGQGLYRGGSMRWGVSLIVLGILGESLLPAPVSVERVIAWLLVLAGMVHVIVAHHALRAGSLISRLIIGFAHVFFGVYLVISPVLGLASLAWVKRFLA